MTKCRNSYKCCMRCKDTTTYAAVYVTSSITVLDGIQEFIYASTSLETKDSLTSARRRINGSLFIIRLFTIAIFVKRHAHCIAFIKIKLHSWFGLLDIVVNSVMFISAQDHYTQTSMLSQINFQIFSNVMTVQWSSTTLL